ncbi:hypothetical protein ACFFP0_25335 [Rhizobium puerariae]|uniref:Uncharacterized protein n=1 Tax=Rhizobium puerariae TaxID=1585791 RepID=A0ABV6ANI9_9HYPH
MTIEIDVIRIALEVAGRVANGSIAIDEIGEEVTALIDTDGLDQDQHETITTLVTSFWLFARNVRIGMASPDH